MHGEELSVHATVRVGFLLCSATAIPFDVVQIAASGRLIISLE